MSLFKREKIFCICANKVLQKYLVKEHADFVDLHNIHFTISSAKIEFNLLHSNPFSDGEIYKITFVLNNLFKVTSLVKEGWDKKCIYKMNVIVELSQFMSTFEFLTKLVLIFCETKLLNLTSLVYIMDACFRERELCELFKSKNKSLKFRLR